MSLDFFCIFYLLAAAAAGRKLDLRGSHFSSFTTKTQRFFAELTIFSLSLADGERDCAWSEEGSGTQYQKRHGVRHEQSIRPVRGNPDGGPSPGPAGRQRLGGRRAVRGRAIPGPNASSAVQPNGPADGREEARDERADGHAASAGDDERGDVRAAAAAAGPGSGRDVRGTAAATAGDDDDAAVQQRHEPGLRHGGQPHQRGAAAERRDGGGARPERAAVESLCVGSHGAAAAPAAAASAAAGGAGQRARQPVRHAASPATAADAAGESVREHDGAAAATDDAAAGEWSNNIAKTGQTQATGGAPGDSVTGRHEITAIESHLRNFRAAVRVRRFITIYQLSLFSLTRLTYLPTPRQQQQALPPTQQQQALPPTQQQYGAPPQPPAPPQLAAAPFGAPP
ncbi:hypothetical protein THAOC_14390, partial [Thalassiosira oceanica]